MVFEIVTEFCSVSSRRQRLVVLVELIKREVMAHPIVTYNTGVPHDKHLLAGNIGARFTYDSK